jgi:integrase
MLRVSQGKDPLTGKWIRQGKLVVGNRRDAEQALTQLLGRQDDGVLPPRVRLTLHAWLEEYAKVWSGGLSPQTRENADQLLKCYIPAPLMGKRLQSLTTTDFQTLYNDLSARGLSPATVSAVHRVLRARLNKAVKLGHLVRNPVLAAELPARSPTEYRVLSPAEAVLFLEEAEHDEYPALWSLLLQTGLRPAEALGLKWEDLDGDRLAVRRTLVRLKGGGWQLEEPKTGKARSVTLPAGVVKALARQRARQAERRLLLGTEYAQHGFIFATDFGHPLHWTNLAARHFAPLLERLAHRILGEPVPTFDPKGLSHKARSARWKAVREAGAAAVTKAGLDGMRPYDLRHSAASLLLAAGEHPKVVQEMLGHANIGITLDTYTHLIPSLQARAAESMEQILAGARTGGRTAAN